MKIPRAGNEFELQLWPMPQVWQQGSFNPLHQSGDWTHARALTWPPAFRLLSHCTTAGTLRVFSIFFFFYLLFRAAHTAYGGSQPRSWFGATAAGLCHSRSNTGSKPHLQPTPQLTAMPDPQPTERGQRLNLHSHDTGWIHFCGATRGTHSQSHLKSQFDLCHLLAKNVQWLPLFLG